MTCPPEGLVPTAYRAGDSIRLYVHAPINSLLLLTNGKVASDLYLIDYLEARGVEYGMISDTELATLADTLPPDLLLFNNYSEYWSYGGIGGVTSIRWAARVWPSSTVTTCTRK